MSVQGTSPAHALLGGLRRAGDEPQLTQAMASICREDHRFAAAFLSLLLEQRGRNVEAPPGLAVSAEEVSGDGRFDLRFRGDEWDVIVELKIHAGYGPGQLERYLKRLSEFEHAYLVAITRDHPLYGEPDTSVHPRWLGSTRWRDLLPELHSLPVADPDLGRQWSLFLDVLEQEGSMGFTRPDPRLFDAFAQARLATKHMEEFLRVLGTPLLQALVDARGGHTDAASLYWPRGGRFSRSRWGKLDIPFRVPAGGPWRVRAGIIGWSPPSAFYVQPGPNQRWDTRLFGPEAQAAVAELVAGEFEPKWMRAYLELDDALVLSPKLEETVLKWAHDRFADIERSGLFALPIESLGDMVPPDEEQEAAP